MDGRDGPLFRDCALTKSAWWRSFLAGICQLILARQTAIFGEHPRHPFGRKGVRKPLALHYVKGARRGKKIEDTAV